MLLGIDAVPFRGQKQCAIVLLRLNLGNEKSDDSYNYKRINEIDKFRVKITNTPHKFNITKQIGDLVSFLFDF